MPHPHFLNLCDVPHFFVSSNLILLFPVPARLGLPPKILMVLLASLRIDCIAWLLETSSWGPEEIMTMGLSKVFTASVDTAIEAQPELPPNVST